MATRHECRGSSGPRLGERCTACGEVITQDRIDARPADMLWGQSTPHGSWMWATDSATGETRPATAAEIAAWRSAPQVSDPEPAATPRKKRKRSCDRW